MRTLTIDAAPARWCKAQFVSGDPRVFLTLTEDQATLVARVETDASGTVSPGTHPGGVADSIACCGRVVAGGALRSGRPGRTSGMLRADLRDGSGADVTLATTGRRADVVGRNAAGESPRCPITTPRKRRAVLTAAGGRARHRHVDLRCAQLPARGDGLVLCAAGHGRALGQQGNGQPPARRRLRAARLLRDPLGAGRDFRLWVAGGACACDLKAPAVSKRRTKPSAKRPSFGRSCCNSWRNSLVKRG